MSTNKEIIEMEFSEKEESYRRGYSQGFLAARKNPDISIQEVYAWRNSDDETAPPGSCFEGQYMHGLKKNEQHRFFIDRLKPKISILDSEIE